MESSSATSHFTIRRSAISETRSNHRCLLPGFVKFRKNFAAERRAVSIKSCMDSSLDGLRIEPYGFRGRDGIIIVDHGSRRKESNLMLNDFVAMFKHKTGYPIVEPAHMDVVNDRVTHCLSHSTGNVEECDVCAGTGKCRFY